MGVRIKDVCKAKKISLAEVARRIGINPVTLSQSLNGNPTLSRLEEVAQVLGVDVSELFDRASTTDVHGCIYINGQPNLIQSKQDLKDVLERIQ